MKSLLLVSAFVLAVGAVASPGTYEGKGQGRNVGGPLSGYTTTVTVKEIKANEVYEVSEVWVGENGHKGTWTNTFHFNADGTMKVKTNGVDVGCGYFFGDANGKWMDWKIQTPEGPAHFNLYHDFKTDTVHRIGDGIFRGQAMFFRDDLVKK